MGAIACSANILFKNGRTPESPDRRGSRSLPHYSSAIAELSYSYKLAEMLSVCLDVNHCRADRNRCTQRLVILRAQIYWSSPIAQQKQTTLTHFAGQNRPPKKWAWIGIFKPGEPRSPWDARSSLRICGSTLQTLCFGVWSA